MKIFDSHELLKTLCALPQEAEWVEFKVGHYDAENIGKYISALANSAMLESQSHGYLVFGVENETHKIVGTDVRLKTQKVGSEPLENWLSKMIDPPITLQFSSVQHDGKHVEILVVDHAFQRPVKFQNLGYIRVGSATKKLNDYPQRESTLWQLTNRLSFEEGVAAYHLSPTEIFDRFLCEGYFESLGHPKIKVGEAIERLLMDGLIVDDQQGAYDVTNLFALLAAKEISQFKTIENKAPRVITYKGSSKLLGQSDVTGQLGYALSFKRLLGYVMERSPHKEEMQTGTRVTVYEYPEIAVRELLANALIHQDFMVTGAPRIEIFADKLRISNPGAPLLDLNRLIDGPARSRNEKLAGMMRKLGFCEERGSGIDRAITAIEQQALPPPDIAVIENTTVVTLFRDKHFTDMSSNQRMMACYLHACLKHLAGIPMSNASLRARFALGERYSTQISAVISEAIAADLLKPLTPNQGNRNARYLPFWAA